MGDGFARVTGRVQDERGVPYQDCRLQLMDARDRSVLWQDMPIAGEFAEGFVISPLPQSYVLRISCMESHETFTSEPTSLAGYPTPIDLGNVLLKRRRRASLPSYGLGSGSPS